MRKSEKVKNKLHHQAIISMVCTLMKHSSRPISIICARNRLVIAKKTDFPQTKTLPYKKECYFDFYVKSVNFKR